MWQPCHASRLPCSKYVYKKYTYLVSAAGAGIILVHTAIDCMDACCTKGMVWGWTGQVWGWAGWGHALKGCQAGFMPGISCLLCES